MDLSEARGLVLFRVIRGGIEISQRLARCRLQAIVILTLEPERLKNRLATTERACCAKVSHRALHETFPRASLIPQD